MLYCAGAAYAAGPLFSVYGVGSSSVPMIIFTLLGALVAIVPWILLAIYFGLQGKKSGPAAYAAPAQYSMPQGYAPQQQGNDLPGGNGGR